MTQLQAELDTYRRLLTQKNQEIQALLADLPAEALLWKPFEGEAWGNPANTLGEILAHGISSTVYLLRRADWILDRIPWEAVEGDEGPDEFGPANHDLAYLRARSDRMVESVNQALDQLTTLEDLAASRPHPVVGRPMNVRYDIQHAIEHLSQHIGHAQLTRQLWEKKIGHG